LVRVIMAMVLCFRRPPVGRAEPAEPVTVAVRLPSGCNRAQPSVNGAMWCRKAQLSIRPGRCSGCRTRCGRGRES